MFLARCKMVNFKTLLLASIFAVSITSSQAQFGPGPAPGVQGPASSTTNNCAKFNGATGKLIADAGAPCGSGTGTVTAVSVASSNGLAGSSSGGATPALTLSTTVTGIVKGDGTSLSAASAGTDYLTPSGNGSALTALNASNVASGTLATARLPTITNSKTITFDSTTVVTAQTISIPIEWTSYTITRVQSAVNGGGSFSVAVKIGATNVTSCNAISVSGATNTNTTCTAANTGSADDIVNVVISAPSGTVNQAYIGIVFTHTAN